MLVRPYNVALLGLVAIIALSLSQPPIAALAYTTPGILQDSNSDADNQEEGSDDSATAGEEQGDDEDLATLKTRFAELREQMLSQSAAFNYASDPVSQAELKKAYMELMDQANQMIGKIKHAAERLFSEDPTNEEAIKTMVGTMMNDAQNQNDAEVLRMGEVLIDGGIPASYFEQAAGAARLSIDAKEIFEELMIRHREAQSDDLPRVKLVLTHGEVVLELFENEAPNTVANFISLVESGFYDGLKLHRVMEGFMAQGGCPKGDGTGDAGYKIACECYSPEARRHFTASLSMAKGQARDTGGSQFFMTFRRTKMLDGRHTVFGRLIKGIEVLDKITRTYDPQTNQPFPGIEPDVIKSAEVLRKRDHEYTPRKVGDPESPAKGDDAPAAQPPTQPGGSDSDQSSA